MTLDTLDELIVIKRLELAPHKKILGSSVPVSGHTEIKSATGGITGLVFCAKVLVTIINKDNSKINRILIPNFL